MLKLPYLGRRIFSDTPCEYPARLIYTWLFQSRAFQVDAKTRSLIKTKCISNSTCVDVGAYRGDILRVFLRHVSNGKVFAFEPDPGSCTFLKMNSPLARIEHTALGNSEDELPFWRSHNRPARNHLVEHHKGNVNSILPHEIIRVPITTLDRYFGEREKIDFIKIDAEGAELGILNGGLEVLNKSKPFLVLEHGPRSDDPQ